MGANFGRFRHLMRIQKASETVSAAQEAVEEWSDWRTWYCSITPVTMSESQRAGASGPLAADATHLLEGWYVSGIAPDMRLVKSDGRIFEIVEVLNEGEIGETMRLSCREAVKVVV